MFFVTAKIYLLSKRKGMTENIKNCVIIETN